MSTSTACGSRLCEIPNTAFFFTSTAGSSLTTRCRISRPRRPRVLPSQNGTFARTCCGCEAARSRSSAAVADGVLVQGNRADGTVDDAIPPLGRWLGRDQRLEQRDALGRLDAGQPRDVTAAGVELAVFREHPHALDLAIDDPEQHDHRVGAFELHRSARLALLRPRGHHRAVDRRFQAAHAAAGLVAASAKVPELKQHMVRSPSTTGTL